MAALRQTRPQSGPLRCAAHERSSSRVCAAHCSHLQEQVKSAGPSDSRESAPMQRSCTCSNTRHPAHCAFYPLSRAYWLHLESVRQGPCIIHPCIIRPQQGQAFALAALKYSVKRAGQRTTSMDRHPPQQGQRSVHRVPLPANPGTDVALPAFQAAIAGQGRAVRLRRFPHPAACLGRHSCAGQLQQGRGGGASKWGARRSLSSLKP